CGVRGRVRLLGGVCCWQPGLFLARLLAMARSAPATPASLRPLREPIALGARAAGAALARSAGTTTAGPASAAGTAPPTGAATASPIAEFARRRRELPPDTRARHLAATRALVVSLFFLGGAG